MNNQSQIPNSLAQPKFQILDQVQCKGRKGTIIGFYWIGDVTAAIDDFDHPGWHYCIDFVHGKSLRQARRVIQSSGSTAAPLEIFAPEDSISLVEDLALVS